MMSIPQAAAQDIARLDWLERTRSEIEHNPHVLVNPWIVRVRMSGDRYYAGATLRDAIDAAMEAGPC